MRNPPHTKRVIVAVLGAMAMLVTLLTAPSSAHDSDNDGHIEANVNYGFEVIGRDILAGVIDGKYTDVWSQDGYAYIGTFQNPSCDDTGVYIVDIEAAIANYAAAGGTSEDGVEPEVDGAVVAKIKAPPDTRVNDVKTITIDDRTVLISTEEPCGQGSKGLQQSGESTLKECPPSSDRDGDGIGDCGRANLNGRKGEKGFDTPPGDLNKGRGGISLWDVTDPTNPKPLNKSYLDFRGVHNTYAWNGADGGTYLIGVADTFDFEDTFIVDISDPKKPELLTVTGLNFWFGGDVIPNLDQLFMGQFGYPLLHDVWVENIDGVDTAVLSYWDLGFVTLDVSDPANPVFLGDTTYRDPDPLTPIVEGNAHAAVFGGNGDYIFGGDEDFDALSFAVNIDGVDYEAGVANFGPDSATISGTVYNTNSLGCTVDSVPPAPSDGLIAVMTRGDCFFQTKALSAEAQGYAGFIIVNNVPGIINMDPGFDDPVAIPGVSISPTDAAALVDGAVVGGAGFSLFNGWGYLHVYNNTGGSLSVPSEQPGPTPTESIPQFGEIGYYAPAETVEPPPDGVDAFERGDLTMHNIEVDPTTQDIVPSFDEGPRMFVSWYSLGMRALEYRPGHYHDNSNGEGSYSWNVHEVGRYIASDGSNFWGVHVDEIDGQQIIVASDRNTGLWIFTFGCEAQGDVEGPFYCTAGTDD